MKEPNDWQGEKHRQQVLQWAREASNQLPSPNNWGLFVAGMKSASFTFQTMPNELAEQRMLIIDMISHVFALLCREPAFDDPTIRSGLLPLMEALLDVEKGVQPSLFKIKPKMGAPRSSVIREQIAGSAARALLELIDANPALDQAQHRLEADKVARAIKAGKCLKHEKTTGKTVISWLADMRCGPGVNGERSAALTRFEAPLPPEAGSTPQSRADFILGSLRLGKGYR